MNCFPAYSAFVLMITFPGTCSVLLTGTWCSFAFLYHSDYSSSLDFQFFLYSSPLYIHLSFSQSFHGYSLAIAGSFTHHSLTILGSFSGHLWPFTHHFLTIVWSFSGHSLVTHSLFFDHSRVMMWSSLVIHSPFSDHSQAILWPFTHNSLVIL